MSTTPLYLVQLPTTQQPPSTLMPMSELSQSPQCRPLPSEVIHLICGFSEDDTKSLRTLALLDWRYHEIAFEHAWRKVSSPTVRKILANVAPEECHKYTNAIRSLSILGNHKQPDGPRKPHLQPLHRTYFAKSGLASKSGLINRALQSFQYNTHTLPPRTVRASCSQSPVLGRVCLGDPDTLLGNDIPLGKLLERLTNLRSIDLTKSDVLATMIFLRDVPDHISQNLVELYLRDRLAGKSAKYFFELLKKLTMLRILDLGNDLILSKDTVTPECLSRLSTMPSLRVFTLSNPLGKDLIGDAMEMSGRSLFTRTTSLSLHADSGTLLPLLDLPSLTHLNLKLSESHPSIDHRIGQLTNLQSLKLTFVTTASFHRHEFQAISALTKLEKLSLNFRRESDSWNFTKGEHESVLFEDSPALKYLTLGKIFAERHHFLMPPDLEPPKSKLDA